MQSQLKRPSVLRLATLFFLGLAALPLTTQAQETQDTTKLAPELRTVRADWSNGVLNRDAGAAGAAFADSVVVQFQGEVFNGKSAAVAWLIDALAGVTSIRFSPSTFVIASGEVVERTSYVVVMADGEAPGVTESTWRKMPDGSWKIVRFIVS